MKGVILLSFLFSLCEGSLDKLEWLVPYNQEAFPQTIKLSRYSISIPTLETEIETVTTTITDVRTAIKGAIFNTTHNIMLNPLADLGDSLNKTSLRIEILVNELEDLTQNKSNLGISHPQYQKEIIDINVGEIFPGLYLVPETSWLLDLEIDKNNVPSPDQTDYRNTLPFLKLVSYSSFTLSFLVNFERDLTSYIKMLRFFMYGESELQSRDLFIKAYLERHFESRFELASINSIQILSDQVLIHLDIFLIDGVSEYLAWKGIQYAGLKIDNKLFTKLKGSSMIEGKDKYFELKCFVKGVCIPWESLCAESLNNGTIWSILNYCDFVHQDDEINLVGSVGFLLNKKPQSEEVKQILDKNKIKIEKFPSLVMVDDCLITDFITTCFESTQKVIHSKFSKSWLSNLIPGFVGRFLQKLTDFPLIFTIGVVHLFTMLLSYIFKCIYYICKIPFDKKKVTINRRTNQPLRESD